MLESFGLIEELTAVERHHELNGNEPLAQVARSAINEIVHLRESIDRMTKSRSQQEADMSVPARNNLHDRIIELERSRAAFRDIADKNAVELARVEDERDELLAQLESMKS